MRTTLEVRTAFRSRHKIREATAALIVFHKPTFCLKKENDNEQLALDGSIKSTSHVYVPTAQLKLASWRRQYLGLWLETGAVAHHTSPPPITCVYV
ncbi:hypothetical protein AVEN_31434-1 [Araneus ventricosus]|uniref:Uncharacterized protein n=1 Tax=Araneus ventricosus TaxID=182803 RepID=A0A4Y2PII8_ARAVE|nr:hypothetical protein AVEN_31434-1 [Araneus ventricosus]